MNFNLNFDLLSVYARRVTYESVLELRSSKERWRGAVANKKFVKAAKAVASMQRGYLAVAGVSQMGGGAAALVHRLNPPMSLLRFKGWLHVRSLRLRQCLCVFAYGSMKTQNSICATLVRVPRSLNWERGLAYCTFEKSKKNRSMFHPING